MHNLRIHGDPGTPEEAQIMLLVLNDLAIKNSNATLDVYATPRVPMEPLEWALTVTGPEGRTSLILYQKHRFSEPVIRAAGEPRTTPSRKTNYVFQPATTQTIPDVDSARRAAQADAEQSSREAKKAAVTTTAEARRKRSTTA